MKDEYKDKSLTASANLLVFGPTDMGGVGIHTSAGDIA